MFISPDSYVPDLPPRLQERLVDWNYSSPVYLYDQESIVTQIQRVTSRSMPYGFTPRYAMKANPHRRILQIMKTHGVHIDACSEHEVYRAIDAGISPEHIQLTGQIMPKNLKKIIEMNVKFCACSLYQLEEFGKLFPGKNVGIRLNPGMGSGQFPGVNVGGAFSSFGIWYELIDSIFEITQKHDLHVTTLHTHIGSGSDPQVWKDVAKLSLDFAKYFPDLKRLNLGGGYKVARTLSESEVDMETVGRYLAECVEQYAKDTDRELHVEVEPGTFYIANAGYLLCQIDDIVHTGTHGHEFLKLDCGMSEIIRPIMYGAKHPMRISASHEDTSKNRHAIVVGHSCESSDMLTVDNQGNPLHLSIPTETKRGDLFLIGGAGAYCSSMATKGYNSYPMVSEWMISEGGVEEITKEENIENLWAREV